MRKITTALLLIIATTGNVFARVTNATCYKGRENANDCRVISGCYWNEEDASCDVCPANMFCKGGRSEVTKYASCDPDVYSELEDDNPTYIAEPSTYIALIQTDYILDNGYLGAVGPEECAVQVTCPAGTGLVWDGTVKGKIRCEDCAMKNTVDTSDEDKWFSVSEYIKNIDSFEGKEFDYEGCDSCGTNSYLISVTTGCKCNDGYHVFNKDNIYVENDHDDCIADAYPVYIYADCDTLDTPMEDISKYLVTHAIGSWEEIKEGYGAYATNKEYVRSNLGDAIEASAPRLSKDGYHLIGDGNSIYEKGDNWYIATTTEADVSSVSKFDYDANILTDDKLNAAIRAQDKSTKYLVCPHWTANTFTIQYDAGQYPNDGSAAFANDSPIKAGTTTKCTYDKNCNIPSDTPIAANGAYVFIGWKITSDSKTSFDTNIVYQPGANFTNATTENGGIIVLTAQWKGCPAGYYACETSEQDGKIYACKCPAGSTSNVGAINIKGCHITSQTQFCSDGECFTLNLGSAYHTDKNTQQCTKVEIPQ